MGSGHTLLTLGAFMLLSTILVSFYDMSASAGDAIGSGQDGIYLTTLTTSYIEIAQGMAYDETTDSLFVPLANIMNLTSPTLLGPETGEDSLTLFDDFDDLDGYSVEKEAGTSNRRYCTQFAVNYVEAVNIEQISSVRTFVKRLDLKTWRTFPVSSEGRVDTMRSSFVMGYFHFD